VTKLPPNQVDLDKTVLVDELSEVVNNTLENVYKKYHDSANFKQFRIRRSVTYDCRT